MILRKSAVQEGAFNLAGLLANVSPKNLTKPNIHRRVTATICDNLEAFSGLRILINPKFFSHFVTSTREKIYWGSLREEDFPIITTRGGKIFLTSPLDAGNLCNSTRTREGEFLESIKKGLPTIANPVYGYSAPAKSGVGIGVPVIIRAHNTRHACFFVPRSYTCSMVDCMGAEQSAPVSLIPGYANPVQFTTSEIGVSGGGSQNHESEAAAMLATTPTQNPQFIWLIAAVRRDMPTITAKIHHIAAETEREARRTLAQDHVCFFAGRIRLEVAA
ncbi:host cell division inhibitor Icd-like protein [Klebsiella quasipneumoniae]|uniref:host cell division inhibitor Icd-like protein n=1 Tax=Klebsiella quasipneumoniae TaxID=1463165 RepID=UPI0035B05AE4